MQHWTRYLAALVAGPLMLTGCGTEPEPEPEPSPRDRTVQRADEPWRGILRGPAEDYRTAVTADGEPMVPATAPAYVLRTPTLDDLRVLAERHVGRAVEPGVMPGASPDLVGYDTGDGWLQTATWTFDDVAFPGYLINTWAWMDRAWRERVVANPPSWESTPCPPGTPTPDAAAFLGELGLAALPTGRLDCTGAIVHGYVYAVLDGVPLVQQLGMVTVDESGEIVEVTMPFLTVEPLGQLELAPAATVVRRLASGPETQPIDGWCAGPCPLTTRGASMALVALNNAGIGHHDHIPGGIVPGMAQTVLLPALRAVPADEAPPGEAIGGAAAIAVSSALLVDDPADAAAAREVDAAVARLGGAETAECARIESAGVGVCASSPTGVSGEPLLITVSGEVNDPVGATECSPLLVVDMGDGVTVTPPPPRAGTLVTSRFVHRYAEPGVYTVTAHRASRCTVTAEPGGSEPEYDETAQIEILVQDAST